MISRPISAKLAAIAGMLLAAHTARSESLLLTASVTSGEATVVLVNVPVKFTYQARMAQPGRIAIDLTFANHNALDPNVHIINVRDQLLKRVMFGEFEAGVVRVLLDLKRTSPEISWKIEPVRSRNALRVIVRDRATSARAEHANVALASLVEPQIPPVSISKVAEKLADDAHGALDPVSAASQSEDDSFTLPARAGIVDEAPITLHDALSMAIENNPDLQASRMEGEETLYRVLAARGVYDPILSASSSFQKQNLPVGSSLGGSVSGSVLARTWQTTPSISGVSPYLGGSYSVSFSSQRDSTNNTFATLSPDYATGLTLEYKQPLWRNLRYDAARHTIEVARKNRTLSEATFRQCVMELVRKTELAYWELAFARRDLEVQLNALRVAHGHERTDYRLVSLGEIAGKDLIAAQTQKANFEAAVYAAQDELTRAENNLKALILGTHAEVLWASALNPVTAPEMPERHVDIAEAIADALRQRPETSQLDVASEINMADQRLVREQLKPQINLTGRYSLAGLTGRAVTTTQTNPLADSLTAALVRLNELSGIAGLDPVTLGAVAPPPASLLGGYGKSLGQLFGGDFSTSFLELRISLPVGNRTSKANLAASLVEARRIAYRKQAVEQAIEAEVRNATQTLDAARQRLQTARTKQQAAQNEYRNEERRFSMGVSTIFLVQQRQLSTVTSISQVHRAEIDVSEALAQFHSAIGDNFSRHGVAIK